MVNTVANVVAGLPKVSGAIYAGPLGTALPTDSATALNVALNSLGYADDSGLVETPTRTTDVKKAWGGDTVRTTQTDYGKTFTFTLIETRNAKVQTAVFGAANVTTTAASSLHGTQYATKDTGNILPHQVWVFDMVDGNSTERIVIEDGQITDIGAVTYSDAEIVGYPVTVTCYRGTTTGAFSVKYGDNGVTV